MDTLKRAKPRCQVSYSESDYRIELRNETTKLKASLIMLNMIHYVQCHSERFWPPSVFPLEFILSISCYLY